MIRWKPFGPYATAALAIIASLYYNHVKDTRLTESRAVAMSAVRAWNDESERADSAEARATYAEARADSIKRVRILAAPARAAIVAAAPDTCKPAIAALTAERDEAVVEAGQRQSALDAQKQATAILRPAGDALAGATSQLAKAAKPSFLSHLIPSIGIGGAAGLSVIDRRPDALIGVTFSWRLR